MDIASLLADAYDRVHGIVHRTVGGLTPQELTYRPDPEANSIAWLIWHLTRIQDDHVAGVSDSEQVWAAQGFHRRFALPFDVEATGYGHSREDVEAVRVNAEQLLEYFDAVHAHTLAYTGRLTDPDLNRIVDEGWNPAVTLGVRLVSVLSDNLQHAGQAAYIRGLLQRARLAPA